MKNNSLRNQFILYVLVISLIIVVISGVIQYYFIESKIDKEIQNQTEMVSTAIQQGIKGTNEASNAIEAQIDAKMISTSKHISDRLKDHSIDEISNETLASLKEEFDLAGLTLFARNETEDDIVALKSTEPEEIGFSFDMFGYLQAHEDLLEGRIPEMPNAYSEENTLVLDIAVSATDPEAGFYKYAYYKHPETEYIINPYIEANEVYEFTEAVGTDSWIEEVKKSGDHILEIGVLRPELFADPSLMEQEYPPLEQIAHGSFNHMSNTDEATLIDLANNSREVSYVENIEGKNIHKLFLPTEDGDVIYVGLDQDAISGPLYKHSLILVVSGFVSLLAIFALTVRFFNTIYKNIQKIITQIKTLESGDFTSKSTIKEKGELSDLSASTNRMSEELSGVLKDTTLEAKKVQNLSADLKLEADESVDKMYGLSIDLTSKAREDNYEVSDFLNALEEKIKTLPEDEDLKDIKMRIEKVRDISDNRSEITTAITVTLADLMNSLQEQSSELSDISNSLFKNMYKFKL